MEAEKEGDEKMNKREWLELREKEKLLKKASEILKVEDKDLPRVVDRFIREIEEMS